MKQTVAVTGGSGGIGHALLERLIDRYEVKALFRSRTAGTEAWIRRGCRPVWGDLSDEEALTSLVSGTTFVFHCAALIAGTQKDSYAVNVEGTRELARAAGRSGCRRFVHVSSIAVYDGVSTDGACSEEAALAEHAEMSVYSRTKLAAEQALKEVAHDSGLEYTILRPTCVYGPHTKPYTLIPIALLRKGLPIILGDGRALMDAVHVDDVAAALVLAAESPQANRHAFNIGHETVTLDEFYSHYSRMLDRPARHLPGAFLRGIAAALQLIPATERIRQLRRTAGLFIRAAENTRRFSSEKAAAVLGYLPVWRLAAGMLQTELWAKQTALIPPAPSTVDGFGELPFRPLAVVRPTSEDEIVQIVEMARDRRIKIRAIGSLHSLSPIPATDGICLVLDRYTKCLTVEGALVTVQAGMTLRELNDILAGLHLALPILGAITAQTAAGAISTATHGGSIHFSSVSDSVESLRIVRADGSVVSLDQSHDLFKAAAVSLGLLGIISTVTFRCVPAFALRSRSTVLPAAQIVADFDDIARRDLYTDILYYAVTDEMEILSIDRMTNEDAAAIPSQQRDASRARSLGDSRIGRQFRSLGLRGLASLLMAHNGLQRRMTRFLVGSSYPVVAGRSDRVLAFGDEGSTRASPLSLLLQDMEIAVPIEHARSAISTMRDYFRTTQKYPLLAIHIRCSGASELWLSPAYHREVCWLEFWMYPRPGGLSTEQIHELMRPFHYRFHWAKDTHVNREYVRQEYEKWDQFGQLRAQWDPTGMFSNAYLESFFPGSA